jgi:hypothetical protein
MDDVMDYLYGPLGKEYCIWFYILSVFGLVAFMMVIISLVIMGFTKKKNSEMFLPMFGIGLSYMIFYFQNRLLYSMCSGQMK